MRLVIFTSYDIKKTDWWPIIVKTPGLEEVLICRKILPNDTVTVFKRVIRNIKKHGLLFIPYRTYHLVKSIYTRFANRNRKESEENPANLAVELIQSEDIQSKDVLDRVKKWKPNLGLSIGAPILRQKLFGMPTMGTINVHCAKLPDFRGAPPGFWEVSEGASEIGASVHWMDEGLDTGDIIASATARIYKNDRVLDVENRALELGQLVLRRALNALTEGKLESTVQHEGGSTFKQPLVTEKMRVHIQNLLARYKYWNNRSGNWVKVFVSLVLLVLYRPVRDGWRRMTGNHPVRIFTFHRVTNLCRDGMTVSPDVFAEQIKSIKKHHKVVSASEAIGLLSGEKPLDGPCAVITFDDGYRSVLSSAFPIMKQAGVTGCCFVSTDLVNTDSIFEHDSGSPVREFLGVMSWDELQHLREEGWDIGAHSATHARMSELSADKLDYEVISPKNKLKQMLGLEQLMVAYPFGLAEDVPENWQKTVRDAGYIANFNDIMGENYPGDNLYDLARIELGGDHDSLSWKIRVHGINLAQYRNIGVFKKAKNKK